MTIKHIGLIGVGLMGHGIGKNLLEKGYALTVMAHRSRQKVESLIAKGATELTTPHDMAKACDMVILCVTGTPQVEQAIYGEYGLLGAVRPRLVIADCSTAEPASTVKIAADVEAKGGHFIDTPMTRTPKEAEAGKLGLMVGGPADVIARVRPVLDCFADTIVASGPVGSAHKLKLISNFLSICHAAVAAEAIAVAAKAGVDMQALKGDVPSRAAAAVAAGCDIALNCWALMEEMIGIASSLPSLPALGRARLSRAMAPIAQVKDFAALPGLLVTRDALLALT